MTIVVTTCRRPGRRIRSFCNELAAVLPEAIRVNRGKQSIEDLAATALSLGASKVIIVGSRRGNPGRLIFMEVGEDYYKWIPPKVIIAGVKLAREVPDSVKPPRIVNMVIGCEEEVSDEVKAFAETLAQALELPYCEAADPEDLKGMGNVVLWVSRHSRSLAFIRFFTLRDMKICGPLIRVERAFLYVSS
ncbi:MAG: hypothetical protein DRN15_03115 [Thermoprotei archaeon]|nr:MAG: hypothetical protein DRN15_03115 [Thermoprotei archaeon]